MKRQSHTRRRAFDTALCALAPGEEAILVALELPEEQAVRLRTLGFCEGHTVRVVRRGRPMIVEVLNTRIGLNERLAGSIRVGRAEARPAPEPLQPCSS